MPRRRNPPRRPLPRSYATAWRPRPSTPPPSPASSPAPASRRSASSPARSGRSSSSAPPLRNELRGPVDRRRCPGSSTSARSTPLKAAIPELTKSALPEASRGVRHRLEMVRRLALVRGLRSVEQTPEFAFILPAAMDAYPKALAIHMIRDGRDVACSLLERGWLRKNHAGRDDAHQPYGAYARFWVEPELADTFEDVSDARRAAWAWRRYVTAVRRQRERVGRGALRAASSPTAKASRGRSPAISASPTSRSPGRSRRCTATRSAATGRSSLPRSSQTSSSRLGRS